MAEGGESVDESCMWVVMPWPVVVLVKNELVTVDWGLRERFKKVVVELKMPLSVIGAQSASTSANERTAAQCPHNVQSTHRHKLCNYTVQSTATGKEPPPPTSSVSNLHLQTATYVYIKHAQEQAAKASKGSPRASHASRTPKLAPVQTPSASCASTPPATPADPQNRNDTLVLPQKPLPRLRDFS